MYETRMCLFVHSFIHSLIYLNNNWFLLLLGTVLGSENTAVNNKTDKIVPVKKLTF